MSEAPARIWRALDRLPLAAWLLLAVAVELLAAGAVAAAIGVPRGGSGDWLVGIAALCAPVVEEGARFALAAAAVSQRGARAASARLGGFLVLFLGFETLAYLALFLVQAPAGTPLALFALARAPSFAAHVLATGLALGFVRMRGGWRWSLLVAAVLAHAALNLAAAPSIGAMLERRGSAAAPVGSSAREAWLEGLLAARDPGAAPVKVLRFDASDDGRAFCGTARLGPVRTATFAVVPDDALRAPPYRVTVSPGIDGAPDRDRARAAALDASIEIDRICVAAGVYRPAAPRRGPPP